MNQAGLARRLGKSRAAVTQMLEEKTNLTIRTLAEVMFALDGELSFAVRLARTPGAPMAAASGGNLKRGRGDCLIA